MRRALILIAASLSSAAQAATYDPQVDPPGIQQLWRVPAADSALGTSWIEERGIERSGDQATFWLFTALASDEQVSPGVVRMARWVRFRGDCPARQLSPLVIVELGKDMKQINRNIIARPSPASPKAGTPVAIALERACGRLKAAPGDTFRAAYSAMAFVWSRDPAAWAKVQGINKSVSGPPVAVNRSAPPASAGAKPPQPMPGYTAAGPKPPPLVAPVPKTPDRTVIGLNRPTFEALRSIRQRNPSAMTVADARELLVAIRRDGSIDPVERDLLGEMTHTFFASIRIGPLGMQPGEVLTVYTAAGETRLVLMSALTAGR